MPWLPPEICAALTLTPPLPPLALLTNIPALCAPVPAAVTGPVAETARSPLPESTALIPESPPDTVAAAIVLLPRLAPICASIPSPWMLETRLRAVIEAALSTFTPIPSSPPLLGVPAPRAITAALAMMVALELLVLIPPPPAPVSVPDTVMLIPPLPRCRAYIAAAVAPEPPAKTCPVVSIPSVPVPPAKAWMPASAAEMVSPPGA